MKKIILFNWKSNPQSWEEAARLLEIIKSRPEFLRKYDVFVACPFVYLERLAKDKKIKAVAQNCFWEKLGGPFTGEISSLMLKNLGCDYVLVGHSERKNLFRETDEIINKKLLAALAGGLKVFLFFGEKQESTSWQNVLAQLAGFLKEIRIKDFSNITFVYEPAYAVSTSGGKRLSAQEAEKKIGLAKGFLKKKFKIDPVVIYGGSVDAYNFLEYAENKRIQGFVIGRASLNPRQLEKIISKT